MKLLNKPPSFYQEGKRNDEYETLVVGICDGDNERAGRLIQVAEIVDAHDVKCVHSDKTAQEVLKGMLSCHILREFTEAQKAKNR